MLSRKLLMTTMGVALSMGFAMGQANAFIGNQFFGGQLNLLSDNSAESQGVDTNGNSELDVGDTLRGIFDIGTIEDQTGGGGTNNLAANGVELSALFEIEVATRVFSNGIDATAGYDFTFVPHAAFEGVYGAGAMIALFEDVGSEFNRNINTGAIAADIAAMELLVTNGSLVMTWGIPAAASLTLTRTTSGAPSALQRIRALPWGCRLVRRSANSIWACRFFPVRYSTATSYRSPGAAQYCRAVVGVTAWSM